MRWQRPDIWSMMPRLLSASAERPGGKMAHRIIIGTWQKTRPMPSGSPTSENKLASKQQGCLGVQTSFSPTARWSAPSSPVRAGNVRFWNASASSKVPCSHCSYSSGCNRTGIRLCTGLDRLIGVRHDAGVDGAPLVADPPQSCPGEDRLVLQSKPGAGHSALFPLGFSKTRHGDQATPLRFTRQADPTCLSLGRRYC